MILQTIGLPARRHGSDSLLLKLVRYVPYVVNVFGNTVCAVLIAKSEGEGNVLVRAS